jgi:hypothetical protein
MASGSGSAPAGDGTSPSPFFLCLFMHYICSHTITVCTQLDPHLVDLIIYQEKGTGSARKDYAEPSGCTNTCGIR